jgi:DNA-binding transcriptional regulator LsrR (DeoR family)
MKQKLQTARNERILWAYFFAGKRMTDIAIEEHLTVGRVSQLIKRARTRGAYELSK